MQAEAATVLEQDDGMSEEWGAIKRAWMRNLKARKVAPKTVEMYTTSFNKLAAWGTTEQVQPAEIDTDEIDSFFADLATTETQFGTLTRGTTMAMDYRHLRVFLGWLSKKEDRAHPMRLSSTPKAEEARPQYIPDDDLRTLLAACTCPHADRHRLDKTVGRRAACRFTAARDRAILRLLADIGVRRGEMSTITRQALHVDDQLVQVTGKGSRTRLVPYGDKTAEDLDDYLRLRARHPDRSHDALWLAVAPHSGALGYAGLGLMLRRRCLQAGLKPLRLHQFRHTAASSQREAGLEDSDAEKIFGWSSAAMLKIYGADQAERRAIKAARALKHADRI